MAPPEKRCLYEVLGLSRDCSPEEIRSAYRRLALQRHPDKLIKAGGLSEAEATAQFQELVHAYEVLSDPKERAWYDSHRSQILFADHGSGGSKSGGMPGSVPNLFAFFSNTVYSGYSDTGKGFYKVYSDLFNTIYQNEINFAKRLGLRMDSVREAPIMGNVESPYTQVTAFYNYWLGFSTVMDFCWVDQYDVMAGPNRKSRRVMEEENKKLRKKAKREYNETVRGLAEFVKKRDKRVIDMMVKKNAELEKRKAEERERKKKMEKEKMERVKNYEEPDWAKVEEEEEEEMGFYGFDQEGNDDKRKNQEFYCVVCSKKFKSEKQWKNHEQSKKHKEKVAELRESFSEVDEEAEEDAEEEIDGFHSSFENVEELDEKLKEHLKVEDEEEEGKEIQEEVIHEGNEDGVGNFHAEEDADEAGRSEDEDEDEDDEMSILKSMVFGHQKIKRKNVSSRGAAELLDTEVQIDNEGDDAEYDNQNSTWRDRRGKKEKGRKNGGKASRGTEETGSTGEEGNIDDNRNTESSTTGAVDRNENDETDFMEYDNRKSTGRNRKGKKGRSKKISGGLFVGDVNTAKSLDEDDSQTKKGHIEDSYVDFEQNESLDKTDERSVKASHKLHDTKTKSKNLSKGRKTKATGKSSGNMCDRCGAEFESRNKLHKHLFETGHATLKSR